MNKQEQRQELWVKAYLHSFVTNYRDPIKLANEALKAFDETFAEVIQKEPTIKESLTDEPSQPETEDWESILKGALGEINIRHAANEDIFYFDYYGTEYNFNKKEPKVWMSYRFGLRQGGRCEEIESKIKAYLNPPNEPTFTAKVLDSNGNETVTLTREEADEIWHNIMTTKKPVRTKELLKIKS